MKLAFRKSTRSKYDREAIERQAAEELERQVAQGKPPAEEWAELETRLAATSFSDLPITDAGHIAEGNDALDDVTANRPEDQAVVLDHVVEADLPGSPEIAGTDVEEVAVAPRTRTTKAATGRATSTRTSAASRASASAAPRAARAKAAKPAAPTTRATARKPAATTGVRTTQTSGTKTSGSKTSGTRTSGSKTSATKTRAASR